MKRHRKMTIFMTNECLCKRSHSKNKKKSLTTKTIMKNSSRSLDKNDLKNILQSHMFVKNRCLPSISGQTTFYGRIQATMLMVFFPDLVSTK